MPAKNDNALFAIFLAPLSSKKYARFSKWIHTLIIKHGNILKNTPSETNIEILERKNILESFGLADTKTLPIIINKKSSTNPKCKKTFTKCFCIRFTKAVKNNKSKAKYKNTTRYCAKNSSTTNPLVSGKNDDLANATHENKINNTQTLIINPLYTILTRASFRYNRFFPLWSAILLHYMVKRNLLCVCENLH